MSLRSRLLLAFFLLSVVPISSIAIYSYLSSRAALRVAARHEAELLTHELELRMASVAAGVSRRVQQLGEVPIEVWAGTGDGQPGAAEGELAARIGETLPFLEGLEFVPTPPSPAATTAMTPPADPTPGVAAAPAVPVAASTPPATPATAPAPPAPAAPTGMPTMAAMPPLPPGATRIDVEVVRRQLDRVRHEISRSLAEAVRRSAEEQRVAQQADRRGRTAREGDAIRAQVDAQLAALAERQTELAARAVASAHPVRTHDAQLLDRELVCPLKSGDQVLGTLRGRVKAKTLLQSVLAQTHRETGEVPFALDSDANLYVARAEDAPRLRALPAALLGGAAAGAGAPRDWVVVSRLDPGSGVRFGIARPLTEALAELRAALARNLAIALGLFGVCLAGIFPLAKRMTRGLDELSAGAERLAHGDLDARVPVERRDELGRLAATFNHMATEIQAQQRELVEQERRRREEEIGHRLLAAENERRGRELEEARQFQLSLLPRELPALPGFSCAVAMRTATEVGGDYYDGLLGADGTVVLALGDATGHGAASATMVTVAKSLFMADAATLPPAEFLERATALVHRMHLGRMAMALTLLRLDGRRALVSSAGMPPLLWFHAATGEVEEIALPGTPLGALPGATYRQSAFELLPGDALLMMSDGFPELRNAAGEPLGYEPARAHFAACARQSPAEILAALDRAAAAHTAGEPLADDVTFLVLRAES